jgi:hypothetical protein
MTSPSLAPSLAHGLSFNDLYDREGLARLDAAFVDWLGSANVEVHARLMAARAAPDQLAVKDESNLLIEVARPLEDFMAALFGVAGEASELRASHSALAPLYDCKRLFVQRYVARAIKPGVAAALDGATVTSEVALPVRLEDGLEAWELAFALAVRAEAGADLVEKPRRRRKPLRPGRSTIPGRSATATGRCSRCRTSSTSSTSCRSRRKSWTALRA